MKIETKKNKLRFLQQIKLNKISKNEIRILSNYKISLKSFIIIYLLFFQLF